jgi:hypothetical protein
VTTRTKNRTIVLNGYKVAAAAAQVGSFATTWMFISALGVTGLAGFGVALVTEFILLASKTVVLSGESRSDAIGWIAIISDAVLNAGGLWPFILRVDQTPSWKMLVDALTLEGDMRKVPALVITLVIGFVLAVAPHRLWRAK